MCDGGGLASGGAAAYGASGAVPGSVAEALRTGNAARITSTPLVWLGLTGRRAGRC